MLSSKFISCLAITTLAVACVLVVLGIIGIVLGSDILQNQVSNQLPLTAQSTQLASWEIPPVPIYLQFWLWECVNKAEVIAGGIPSIRERGPFTYLEVRTKRGVYFNDNYTVTYRQPTTYSFIPEKSVAPEETQLLMINAPMVTIVSLIRSQKNFTQELVDLLLKLFNESLFVNHTAREWIWGYEDPLLKAAQAFPIIGPHIPDDHFGYFYSKNATDDGLYTVFTGGTNIDLLNSVNKWNGVSYLNYWKTQYANQINGTDGSWFAPLYKKDLLNERLYIYSTDVCRSLYAKFDEHSSVLNIPTEMFTIPSEIFVNGTLNPDNIPFDVTYSGVLNVSICRQGAPIFISLPHLLYADEQLIQRIEGLAPDKNVHQTLFEVEPHTGLVLRAQKRLQINLYIKSEEFIDDMKQISEMILPAIWINESTVIDQKAANDLNKQVLRLFTIARLASIGLISIGAILFIVTTILFARRKPRRNSSARLLYAEPKDTIARYD